MKQGLTQKEALQAVIDGAARGMRDFPDIRIGIINCMMHKGENAAFNWEENLETIRVTKELLGDISIPACVNARNSFGGTAPDEVRRQISAGRTWLNRIR